MSFDATTMANWPAFAAAGAAYQAAQQQANQARATAAAAASNLDAANLALVAAERNLGTSRIAVGIAAVALRDELAGVMTAVAPNVGSAIS